jgi:hypothetical protein
MTDDVNTDDTVVDSGDTGDAGDTGNTEVAERPENVPEKFWDAEAGQLRSDALLKSYTELEKSWVNPDKLKTQWEEERLATRPETPADYALPDDERFDPEALSSSPIVDLWRNAAHEAGVGQEKFNDVLVQYAEKIGEQTAAQLESEFEALGENAQSRIDAAGQWASKYFKDGELGAVQQIASTAAGVSVLEKFMKATRESGALAEEGSPTDSADTIESIEKLMQTRAYYSPADFDPAVRKRVEEFFKKQGK